MVGLRIGKGEGRVGGGGGGGSGSGSGIGSFDNGGDWCKEQERREEKRRKCVEKLSLVAHSLMTSILT